MIQPLAKSIYHEGRQLGITLREAAFLVGKDLIDVGSVHYTVRPGVTWQQIDVALAELR